MTSARQDNVGVKDAAIKAKSFLIRGDLTLKDAMRQMSKIGEKVLFIVDGKEALLGSITDGDIRRWFLKDGNLLAGIADVYNKNPVFVKEGYKKEDVKKLMLKHKINWIPLLSKDGIVLDVLLWEKIFGDAEVSPKEKIDIPIVIMAGGKGTRLDPFTKILPKPLIPIKEKTIIETIMDKFIQYSVDHFYIAINHKSKLIRAYFEESHIAQKIHFIEEDQPLGTAGSLRLIKNEIADSVFVSNCDIIVETNYNDIIDFHRDKNYELTLVGSFRHFVIPYGICSVENGGQLINIEEKPEYDFLVNTGMYVIKRSALDFIPKGEVFHITDLVKSIKDSGGQVGVFPIDEKSWIDIGQWEEYHDAVRNFESQL